MISFLLISLIYQLVVDNIQVYGTTVPSGQPSSQPTGINNLLYGYTFMHVMLPGDISPWINSNLATYDSPSNSMVFNAASSLNLDLGAVTLQTQTRGFTATFVFKFTATTVSSSETIFDCGDGSYNNNILITRSGTTSHLLFSLYNGATVASSYVSTYSFAQNIIYVVTFAYYSSTKTINLFVNNNNTETFVGTTALTGPNTHSHCYLGKSFKSSNAFLTGNLFFFAGIIYY